MKFFVSTLVFLLTQNSFAKTCVLSILDNQSKDSIYFSHRVSAVFKNYVDADLFEMPSLEQIKLCFSSGLYSEIIWLSHGTPVNHDPTAEYASPVYLNKKNNQVAKTILPSRFFEKLAELSSGTNIKKFRIGFCGAENSSMKPLIDFFKSNSVLVDILPKSETWSALLNEEVSSLTYEWLSQSLDKNKVKSWSTPLNSYCIVDSILDGCDRGQSPYYLPINTRE